MLAAPIDGRPHRHGWLGDAYRTPSALLDIPYPDPVIDPRLLRDEPDRLREAQRRRGLPTAIIDDAIAADERRRSTIAAFESLRAEQKQLGARIPKASRGREGGAARPHQGAVGGGQGGRGRPGRGRGRPSGPSPPPSPTRPPPRRPRAARTTTSCSRRSARRATSPPRASSRATTSSWARSSGAIDLERGTKVSGARFYYLTGPGADLEMALVNLAFDKARAAGFTPRSSRRRW